MRTSRACLFGLEMEEGAHREMDDYQSTFRKVYSEAASVPTSLKSPALIDNDAVGLLPSPWVGSKKKWRSGFGKDVQSLQWI